MEIEMETFQSGNRIQQVTADGTYKGVVLAPANQDGKVLVRWDIGVDSLVSASKIAVIDRSRPWTV
jgi:hypothetical protein